MRAPRQSPRLGSAVRQIGSAGAEVGQNKGVLRPYLKVLSVPGASAFSIAGVFARLPISMLGLSIILMISQLYGEYGIAGRVAAVFIAIQAICSPQIAKLVDRHGQARIMRPAIVLHLTGLAIVATAVLLHAPEWLLYLSVAPAAITMGSMGAMVRARWSHILDDPRDVHVAYSLESVFDEVTFIIGPVLATILSTVVFPGAGILVSSLALAIGGFIMLGQKGTEPPPSGRDHSTKGSVMASAAMLIVVGIFMLVGAIFGSSDVATVAFTEARGMDGYAGAILACFAAGSLISGLIYGSRNWVQPVDRRFIIGVIALAIGVAPLVLITSVPVLAAVMFIAGFAIAPTLISGNALVQEFVAPGRLTEGLTWVGTALGVGVALGSSAAGSVIDQFGPHGGFASAAVAGALVVTIALIFRPALALDRPE